MTAMFVQQLVNGLIIGSVYALVALGLTMSFGLMNIVNFAHGQIVTIGAFVCYFALTLLDVNFIAAALIAMAAAFLLGLLLERYTFRFARASPVNGLMISIGLILVIENSSIVLFGVETRTIDPIFPGVIDVGEIVFAKQRLLAFTCSALLLALLFLFLRRTRIGKAIRAIPQDREAAQLMGINIDRITGIAFGLGCALAAIAGALLGSLFVISPFMGERPLMKAFVIITLGGFGSIPGAVVAALILGILESLGAAFVSSEWQDAFGFVLLILILLFRPMGLFGER
jgi:branched-chain amino acid transport system permease protein